MCLASACEECAPLVWPPLTRPLLPPQIMNYYATHRIHRETSDGIPAKLKQVDTKDPHPPAAIKEVIYDFKIAQASLAARDWWKASPPPPTLPPHIG